MSFESRMRQIGHALLGLSRGAAAEEKKFAAATSQVILTDLIQQGIKLQEKHGVGAIAICLVDGDWETAYITRADMERDLPMAEEMMDSGMARILRAGIQQCDQMNPEREILMINFGPKGSGRAALYRLDKDVAPERAAETIRSLF